MTTAAGIAQASADCHVVQITSVTPDNTVRTKTITVFASRMADTTRATPGMADVALMKDSIAASTDATILAARIDSPAQTQTDMVSEFAQPLAIRTTTATVVAVTTEPATTVDHANAGK